MLMSLMKNLLILMKTRTLLVDSSFLLKRSFFGAKNLYTNKFGHIGALYSFLTKLRKLIKDHKINKVVLAWDGENSGFYRHVIEPAYKANRKDKEWYNKIELTESELKKEREKEESILKQKKRIQAYAEELFIRQIEVDKIEAEDIIASYCMQYHKKEEITIYTNDRDFSQLLVYDIKIIFDNKEELITKQNFFFEFDYHYSNSLIMKVICGDSSDNIKGIQGIKEKSLLKYFPDLKYKNLSVRQICKMADELNKERIQNKKKPLKIFENLLSNIDVLVVNHKLMNLSSPFLNENAEHELEQLKMPLSDEDRNSKNLYKMMIDDEFLTVYEGSYVNYIEPFYSVIMNEKEILKKYLQDNKPIL